MLSAEPGPSLWLWAGSRVTNSLRALWNEPRPAQPPARVWRDWVLLGVAVSASLIEAVLRPDRAWLLVTLVVSIVVALSLLWRRTRPLAAVAVVFGTLIVFDVTRIVASDATGPLSIAAALVLSYALLRWGSGREAVIGLGIILVWLGVTHLVDPTTVQEVVAGYHRSLSAHITSTRHVLGESWFGCTIGAIWNIQIAAKPAAAAITGRLSVSSGLVRFSARRR